MNGTSPISLQGRQFMNESTLIFSQTCMAVILLIKRPLIEEHQSYIPDDLILEQYGSMYIQHFFQESLNGKNNMELCHSRRYSEICETSFPHQYILCSSEICCYIIHQG